MFDNLLQAAMPGTFTIALLNLFQYPNILFAARQLVRYAAGAITR